MDGISEWKESNWGCIERLCLTDSDRSIALSSRLGLIFKMDALSLARSTSLESNEGNRIFADAIVAVLYCRWSSLWGTCPLPNLCFGSYSSSTTTSIESKEL